MRMNQCTIIGRLGADAKLQRVLDTDVLHFDVAVSAFRKEGKPQWFRIDLWGPRAPKLEPYLRKGQAVCVTGEVSVREYVRKDGIMSASAQIRASDVVLLGSNQRGDNDAH